MKIIDAFLLEIDHKNGNINRVAKLKRFNANDISDVSAMVAGGWLKRNALIERFRKAVDGFIMDARAEEIPYYIKNLHTVERDYFRAPASEIELPDWL